ncbi:MAG: A/G-specific adenine glycosylase [Dehalococcoidia bacterium]
MLWYADFGRHALPWRQTRDPYAVLVSEVMLQQTQVERVIPYYDGWLARWPAPTVLAEAPLPDVLRLWAGLGYNRRAVNLHRAAVAVVERHGGRVPLDEPVLRALPGIGPYTAAAVASFAGERRAAPADTNIARVVARAVCGMASQRDVPPGALAAALEEVLPKDGRGARDHNLALMDVGALLCTSRQPACLLCPLAAECRWRAAGRPASAVTPAKPQPRFVETARFARGRIVDALRDDAELSVAALGEMLPPRHRPELGRYLLALQRDGVIDGEGDRWWLAGHSGSKSIASPKE